LKKILIINGPNLNLLGKREPVLYGHADFSEVLANLQSRFSDLQISVRQFNEEEAIIDALHAAEEQGVSGIVLNPAAFTHTSLAIADARAAISIPVVEVHISNVAAREVFRQKSFVSRVARGVVQGFGVDSYRLALAYFSGSDE